MDEIKLLKKKIDNYGNILINEYLKGGSLSKRKRLAYDLYWFSMIYRYIDKEKVFPWYQDNEYTKLTETLFNDNLLSFFNFTLNNNEFYTLSQNIINSFKEVKYPFYKNYYNCIPKITNLERNKIIMSFLTSYAIAF